MNDVNIISEAKQEGRKESRVASESADDTPVECSGDDQQQRARESKSAMKSSVI